MGKAVRVLCQLPARGCNRIGQAHASEQLLDVKSIQDLKNRLKGIRQTKDCNIFRRRKDGEAVHLKAQEFVVIDKIVKLFALQRDCALVTMRPSGFSGPPAC